MRLVFPNSHRINRGTYVVKELAAACRANDVSDLIILHEHRGTPDALIVSHFPHGPTLYFTLHNVALRHDIAAYGESTVSEQYPHLIFEGFSSRLGNRVMDALRYLFPVPKEDAKRVMTFANDNDFISFRYDFSHSWSSGSQVSMHPGITFSSRAHINKCNLQRLDLGLRWNVSQYSTNILYDDSWASVLSVWNSSRNYWADRSRPGVGLSTLHTDSQKAPATLDM